MTPEQLKTLKDCTRRLHIHRAAGNIVPVGIVDEIDAILATIEESKPTDPDAHITDIDAYLEAKRKRARDTDFASIEGEGAEPCQTNSPKCLTPPESAKEGAKPVGYTNLTELATAKSGQISGGAFWLHARGHTNIPLYTTPQPAKVMTDEEIERLQLVFCEGYRDGHAKTNAEVTMVTTAHYCGVGTALRYARDNGYLAPAPPVDIERIMEMVKELIRTHEGFHEAIRHITGLPYPWEPWDAAMDKWKALTNALTP